MNQPKWTVLLIGGSSATGKSFLGRRVAEYFNIPLLELDDIRLAVQEYSDEKREPGLFSFVKNPDYLKKFSIEELVDHLEGSEEACGQP